MEFNRKRTLFLSFLIVSSLYLHPLSSQPVVVPNLNTPVFNSNSMNQTFTVADGMQTIGNWDAFVFQSVSILQTQWEAQVQAQISMIVNSVTTSDHFASVQDYQSYMYNSLQGQASEQLLAWQSTVETEILSERSEYLSALYGSNSGAVASSTAQFQSQWDAFVSGSGLNLNLGGALSQAVLNSGQQTLEGLESQWWNDFNQNLQSGLQTYQEALQGLTTKYQNLLSQINATEMQYQAHLAQIQQSQSGVKDQILSSLEGYQSFLNGNSLFWNSISILYDNTSNSYVQASCPGGHSCTTFQYDPTNSQFYTLGSCPAGHTCANVLYDTTDSKYLQNTVCPSVCDGSEVENLSVRTGLNADGRAFQNVINNVANALQEGYVMPAIFDYTSGTMISYNANCLSGSSCVKGLYDSTSDTFVASTTCSAGHTCYSAVVDNTIPASTTGSYFTNSCPVGDTRCVSCQAGHTCQVQDMEAGFLYASNLMTSFLHNELLATQGALQNAINYQNGNGTNQYQYGSSSGESFDNSGLSYMWGNSDFSHFAAKANSAVAVRVDTLWGSETTGEIGLAKQIMAYIRQEISEMDLANWIMDAYSNGLSGSSMDLPGIGGLGPGITITGISHADLRAFEDQDTPPANFGPNQYCPDWLGCYSGDIFNPTPGIYMANRTYSQQQNVGGAWGSNFYDYFAREAGVWAGVPFLADVQHMQDYAWIELNFTVSNNNAYANVTTYQDLVLQLQAFEHDWQNNVMPSITNWTAQSASYQAQYANWQTEMQAALADAQNTFNSGVQDLQGQESAWLAQMGVVQQQAANAFQAAENALKNAKGQTNYGQLTQEVLAGINQGRTKSNIDGEVVANTSLFTDAFGTILSGLDRNADRNIPDFGLLSTLGSSFSRAITGASNLSLLSSTNNATLDTILGYMNGVADSMRKEKQFSQNGQSDLIEAHQLKTKSVESKDTYSGETITTTYVLNADGSLGQKIQDWIKATCGDDLSNGHCNQFIENKYTSVDVDKSGKLTAHRNVYDGSTSLCGAMDATNLDSYCFGTDDAVVTIAPPNGGMFLLGRGASRLGDIFDGNDNQVGDLVNSTFQNVNAFLSSNKHMSGLFTEVNAAQRLNDENSSIASADANNRVKIANIVVDYVEAVLLGGMSTSAWVNKQAQSAIQDVVATVIAKAFDLPPDVAAFLSGGLMAHMEMSKAKHDMGTKNLGIQKGIHNVLDAYGLEPLEGLFAKVGTGLGTVLDGIGGNYAKALGIQNFNSGIGAAFEGYDKNLAAIERWKDFKNSLYGFGVQKAAIANGMSPAFAGALAQYTIDYMEMRHAKEELGMRSGAFSLQSLGGNLQSAFASIGGAVAEVIGAELQTMIHLSGDLGLTSEKYEKHLNKEMRTIINDIKLKDLKDDIRNWDSDQAMLASEAVKEYGRVNHLDQKTIDLWSQQASDFVVRKQAERDLNRRDDFLKIGTVVTGGILSPLLLDAKLFGGGLTTLVSKGFKGVMTSIADLGNLFGESIVSSDFKDSVYDQTKVWHNTITQQDVKARSQQGIINQAFVQKEMRNLLFDAIGEFLVPGDKTMGHNLGLLLKHHIDQQEAKKDAREQKLKDAQTIVQVAAAAAAIYFSAGTASGAANSWLSSVAIQTGTATTASVGGVSTVVATGLTNGQLIALAASTAVNMAVESSINGSNGAIAAFANGLISAATLGVKTPVTGFVSYTKHQNANLLTGQQEVKGGWGGGLSLNVVGSDVNNQAMALILNNLNYAGFNAGFSYNQDAGLGANVGLNFKGGSVGLDYNFKSGDYTANASYDAWDSKNDKHHAGFSVSAGKNGSASLDGYYNYGNKDIPPQLRGHGGTLSFSNDGTMSLSGQMQGATIGTLTYDTNTHGFQPISLNQNFQNEFNQGLAAENAQFNHSKSQLELVKPLIATGLKMGLYSSAEIDQFLPKDKDGNIDVDRANPSELLSKWNDYKGKMSGSDESVKIWKDQVSKAGEAAGLKINFNDGKSATSTFGKFVSGIAGDIAQSFGFANDGSKMADKSGVFHLDTCFVAGTQVHLATGTKSIEEIQIGDVVVSWNEKTNTFENKRVTELFVHEVPQLFDLELNDEETLHTTWNHPFRRRATANNDLATSEWVKTEDLKVQDQVLKSDGSWARVTGLFHYNVEPTLVYNIEVEDNHTYVVGVNGVVVHNYEKQRPEVSAAMNRTERLSKLAPEDREFVSSLDDLKHLGKEFIKNGAEASKETNRLLFETFSAKQNLEVQGKKNLDFVTMVRSKDADSLPGIGKIRDVLKGIDPAKGYSKHQLSEIDTWLRQDLSKNLPSGVAGIKDMVGGYSSGAFRLGGLNKPGNTRTLSEMGTHVGLWKVGRELSETQTMNLGRQRITDSETALVAHQNKIKERGVAEAKAIRAVEDRVEAYVAHRYGNDPKFAEAIVSSRTIDKSSLSKNSDGVDFDTKRKAFEFNLKPGDRAKIQEFDKQISSILETQNRLEREDYEKHQKHHPGEPYQRSADLNQRREKMIATREHLEKQRSNFVNETITHFPMEPRRIELEKLVLSGKITDKERNELNAIDKAKTKYNEQVANLLDTNSNTMHTTLETVFGKERMLVANDRTELTQNLLNKEDKLRTLDPKKDKAEYDKLNKEIQTIQERTAQLDKNFLDFKPVRKADESLEKFLLREKDSYAGEPKAIERITEGLEAQKKHYKALGDVAKVKEINDKIDKFEKRSQESLKLAENDVLTLALRKGGAEREKALQDMKEYLTHADKRDSNEYERELPISDHIKNPVGNPEGKKLAVNSHFGRGGYGNQEVVGAYLHSNDHTGLDGGGVKGERINSVLEGKVKGEPTKGLSITLPGEMPAHLKEKGIAYSEPLYDGNGNKMRDAGYYDPDGKVYSANKLGEMDSKYRKANPELAKIEKPFESVRSVGVISDKGKFYTMANAKTPVELTLAQLALVPEEIRRKPELANSNGNGVSIETTLTGVFAGKYELQYKHFDSIPRNENGQPLTKGDTIKAGQKIGDLGTTGRSTGAHLHISVVSYEKPNGVSPVFYNAVADKKGNIVYYLINPQYFIKVMAPSGVKR
ncbi:TIGR04388 family protein [Leptospira sp. 201903071]|uniref:TIGR04388 family protein n=1 Tax=Leptospira ainazelensis TaxID=2810034 RepID=UPI001965ABC3|nr:TIGR04388 family protein [Leptospira ainazelensis]MBM9498960.1 TIGR04388 family protein [Leptospira ainazelensis]